MTKILFDLGQTVATPGSLDELERAGVDPGTLLFKHATGDFGTCGKYDDITLTPYELEKGALATADDGKLNRWGIDTGDGRILSAYILPTDVKVWVITEWDRSVTTILLPREY